MDNQIKKQEFPFGRALDRVEYTICLLNEIRGKRVRVKTDNENDYEFVFVNAGNGKKQMAVF